MDYQDVLDFWYELPLDYHKWFTNGRDYDIIIKKKFRNLLNAAENGYLLDWITTKYSYLALIILLDQFSRHIYRGTVKAYQNDDLTLLLVHMGLFYLHDMNAKEQIFILLPFQHSENIQNSRYGLTILQNLIKTTKEYSEKNILKRLEFHHKRHLNALIQFGRFPWRNKTLGRESSEEEIDYLDENPDYNSY